MTRRPARALALAALVALGAGAVVAEAPARSPLPPLRPGAVTGTALGAALGAAGGAAGSAVTGTAMPGTKAGAALRPVLRPAAPPPAVRLMLPSAAAPAPAGSALHLPEATGAPVPVGPALHLPGATAAARPELRPRGRPESGAGAAVGPVRPVLRPAAAAEPVWTAAAVSPRPRRRPSDLARRLVSARRAGRPAPDPDGAGWVCGDPAIRGVRVTAISSPVPGCGIDQPVRVSAISGIALKRPAVLACGTAVALKRWIGLGLTPAVGRTGGGVAALDVAASYACRPRNNVPGAKISEHGKGHAIDISGLELADGRRVTVAADWRRAGFLRRAYKAACGIFGTTLGPGADGYHKTHMHFDIARYRGGAYCR